MGHPGFDNVAEVTLAEHDEMVETLPPDRADPPFDAPVVPAENTIRAHGRLEAALHRGGMIDALRLIAWILASSFKSRARLGAEILILRHQLIILRRKAPPRPRLSILDRLIFVSLYRVRPSFVSAVTLVRPETVVRWH